MKLLTALDEPSGTILDVLALSPAERDNLHGARVAHRHGYAPVCRHCYDAVHLVINHHQTIFWRHNPGTSSRCLLADVYPNGESDEHFNAKRDLVKTFRTLNGWHAEPEHRFESANETVIADVWALHDRPRDHQLETIYEIQLTKQTHGEFVDRTEQRRRVAGVRTAWVTPHGAALDGQLGIITDPSGQLVVDRVYDSPYTQERTAPMATSAFVKAIARKHPKLLWVQERLPDGNIGWMAYPPESVNDRRKRIPAAPKIAQAGDDADTCPRAQLTLEHHEDTGRWIPPYAITDAPLPICECEYCVAGATQRVKP